MTKRIPLYGERNSRYKGIVIKSSDYDGIIAPKAVNEKHEEIQRMTDRRKVVDGEQHGWIEYDENGEVVDWDVDDKLLDK